MIIYVTLKSFLSIFRYYKILIYQYLHIFKRINKIFKNYFHVNVLEIKIVKAIILILIKLDSTEV